MRRSGQPAGFIKVKQREAALAKSHRPLGSLFTEANQFSLVGGEGVGEMLFQATPQALDRLARIIDTKAEATPRMKENKNTGALEPAVSRYRSEVGGVDISSFTELLIRFVSRPRKPWHGFVSRTS